MQGIGLLQIMLFKRVVGIHKSTPTPTFPTTTMFAATATATTATVVGGAIHTMNHDGTLWWWKGESG